MIDLSLTGALDQQRIVSFHARLKTLLAETNVSLRRSRRVLAIVVEFAHNVQRYSADREHDRAPGGGSVRVRETQTAWTVTARNPVADRDVPALTRTLSRVAGLHGREMKDAYRSARRGVRRSTSTGLGLYEIARKSDIGIQWKLEREDGRPMLVVSASVAKHDTPLVRYIT